MKIEQVRKIKSIESEFLKLSKNDKVFLTMLSVSHNCNLFSSGREHLNVEMRMFDDDLGDIKVEIEASSPKQVENLRVVLEMLQGSV